MRTLFLYLSLMTLTLNSQTTVSLVDLNNYAGKWYVIACIPTKVDQHWNYITETYTIRENGKIDIFTTYIKENRPGSKKAPKQKHLRSKGFPQTDSNNFKWKVQFIWPFKVDYLIEEVPEDYSYTIVGHPEKKFLYIMAREKQMNEDLLKNLIQRYKEKGYPVQKLIRIPQ